MGRIARGTGAAAAAVVLLLSGAAVGHQKAAEVEGVLGLDVYASGDVVDVLVAVREGAGGVELRHTRSADGGRTFPPPRAIPVSRGRIATPRRGDDPQIASSGERIVVLWTGPGTSPWGTGALESAVSEDGGRSWGSASNPADDRSDDAHGFVDVASTGPNRFLAVWLDGRDGAQGLRSAASADGGKTWGKNSTIEGKTCECCANRLLVRDGAVDVIYRQRSPRDMAVATTTDAGATWTRRGAAARFGWEFDGCPEVGGALAASKVGGRDRLQAVAWTGKESVAGVWTVASGDSGATWSKPTRLGDETARQLDMAGSGACLTAAWDEYRAATKRKVVVASSSCDGGATWSKPHILSNAGVDASYPLASATSGGTVVAWTERAGHDPVRWAWRVVAPPAP